MPALETILEAAGETVPENLVEIGRYQTAAEGGDHGLVVLAMRHAYWLVAVDEHFRLLVEPAVAAAAREQLLRFDRESVGWPPPPIEGGIARREPEMLTPLIWCFVVLAAFRCQIEWPNLTEVGALDAQGIFSRGEWWRIVTALFLHADAGHVVSNVLSGLFVFSAVLTTIGLLRGWLLLALASLTGNLAVAAIKFPADYSSLGASTAIFAGLGLLTGRAIRLAAASSFPHRWRSILVPLAAGTTILALYGAGGVNIDVGAHLTGFVTGTVLGVIGSREKPTG